MYPPASFIPKLESCTQRDDRAKCCVEKHRAPVYRAVKAPDPRRRRRCDPYGYGACVCANVNDVDDDEEGAGAYFSLVRHSDGHTKCELEQSFYCSPMDGSFADTKYLDNDVYVNDVVDDEAGTGAYWCSGPHTHCEGTDDHRQSFYPELGIPSLRNIDHWMHHSQSPVSRTSLSTAWRMLQESVSKRMLSSECLYAEPFTWSPQSLPSFEPSNVLLHEGSTKCHGPPCREYS